LWPVNAFDIESAQYGTLTLGKQYDSVVDYLSPLALAGQAGVVNLAAHPLNNDNIVAQYSINNTIKYESVNYSGFHFGGLYGFSNDPGQFANGRAWSVGSG
jgi:predicted porin